MEPYLSLFRVDTDTGSLSNTDGIMGPVQDFLAEGKVCVPAPTVTEGTNVLLSGVIFFFLFFCGLNSLEVLFFYGVLIFFVCVSLCLFVCVVLCM